MNQKSNLVRLDISEKISVNDCLSLELIRFTHKPSPMIGAAQRGTAHIIFNLLDESKELLVSTHGIAGLSKDKDGLTDK